MTRKKSKMKALALAVTCAVLAGGYSVEPVYAAKIYADSTDGTAYVDKATSDRDEVEQVTLGQVIVNGSTQSSDSYINTTTGNLLINGATFKNGGVAELTAGSKVGGFMFTADGMVVDNKTVSFAEMKAATDAVKATGDDALVKSKDIGTIKDATTKLSKKTSKLNDDGNELTGMTTVQAETFKAGEQEITASKITGYDAAVTNTGGITRDQKGLGGVFNRTIIEGLSVASDNSNVFLYTGGWSETSGVNNAAIKISRGTDGNSEVTIPSLYIDTIGNSKNYSDEGITFTDLKGAVNATDSSEEGTLAYNTQKISYHAASGNIGAYTDVTGELRITGESGSRAVLSLRDNENSIDITANEMAHMKEATTQITYNNDTTTSVNGTKFIANNDGSARGVITDYIQIGEGSESYKLDFAQLKAVNSVLGKDNTINAAIGSVVGKVKFNDKGIVVNDGEDQQVIIDEKGLKVGQNSSRMNDSTGFSTSKNLYVGTADADNPTQENSKFYVDGTTGNVYSKGSVTADSAGFNNLAVKNGLTVGDSDPNGNFVNMTGGNLVATGNITAMKDVGVGGNLTVSGASKSKTLAAGTNGDEFTVDENGNVVAKGTLSAAEGKFSVDADGAITGANGKFKVDKDGNTEVGGTLGVTGKATLSDDLEVGKNATIGGTLGVTGATTLSSTLEVTGKTTLKDALEVKGKATFGNAPGALTEIDGDKFTTGVITTDKAQESNIGGVKMSNGKITADNMTITGKLDLDNLQVNENLQVGSFAVDKTGKVTGVASINDVSVTKNGTGLKIGSATVGDSNPFSSNGFTVDATGNVTAGTYNGNTITTDKKFNDVKLDGGNVEATKVTAGTFTDGNGFTATSGNVAAKNVTADTATIAGVSFASGGNVSGVNNLTASGTVKAGTLKVNDNNALTSDGLKAEKAVIDNLTIDGDSIMSNNATGSVGIAGITVDKNGALTGVSSLDGVNITGNSTSGLTVGTGATAVTIGGNSLALSSTGFNVDDDGDVSGKSFTAGGSSLKDGELKLNDANVWTTAEGIKAEKAAIGANTFDASGMSTTGTLGVAGKATFGDSTSGNYTTVNGGTVEVSANGGKTTIEGGKVTTKTLDVEDIILRNEMKDGAGNTITIKGSDGSISVAGGAFAVDAEGQLTNKISGTAGGYTYETNLKTSKSGINASYTNGVNGNKNSFAMGQEGISLGVEDTSGNGSGFKADASSALMGYGTANSITVNADTIKSALGTDVTRVMTNGAQKSITDKVGSATRTMTEEEITDAAAGMKVTTNNAGTTFTNGTTTTNINGSSITSTNGAATGVLDGSNLTLTNGSNSTKLTAGGATFVGAAGESNKKGNTTTIDGGTITTDTLNVERINLGEEMHDADGTVHGANLSMDKQGNLMAAGGNFTVIGGSGADKGSFTNKVGNTTLSTSTSGAGMSYDNGTVKSEVSVADGKANVSAGAGSIGVTNDEVKSAVGSDASSTITKDSIVDKVGNNSVTTDKNGTTFDNGSGKTTINGDTITTGKLVTDELVITGSGEAAGAGTGSIAFGGNGTIKSDIKDGDKNTKFTTDIDGVTTSVTDGTNTTTNEVKATGNTSTVTNGTASSKNTQTATSIGGVVTNGTVKIAQTLDGENGNITSEVTDADGNSSKLVQDGKGLTYTDSANAGNATRITGSDVSIGSATDDSKRINLSDLGQIDDLDSELSARDEFKNNSTAVGGINAEAAARREDVARLDNRIDDVNNRVDKVGAMAAAIASLKSIGYDPQAPSEFSIGLGQYKGETGVAMGFFHYPNKNFMINVSLSTAGGETMGGIGATWRFGHKSPQKLLNEQREAQAKKELAAAEKYKAAAQLAKEAQERAEYAAKLARQAQVSADNAKAAADATQAKHFNQ